MIFKFLKRISLTLKPKIIISVLIYFTVVKLFLAFAPPAKAQTQNNNLALSKSANFIPEFSNIVIGPELVFENAVTTKSWQKRLDSYNNKKIFSLGIYGSFGRSKQINPQDPTKDGEYTQTKILAYAIKEQCPNCQMEVLPGKHEGIPAFHITFPNGYYILVDCDPGVVEIQTKPLPYIEYVKLANFIQKNIYNVAAKVGLTPSNSTDGHSNISVETAFKNVKNLSAFILDMVQHPELSMGVLGHDLMNAPPLQILTREQQNNFYELIQNIKDNKIFGINAFLKQMMDKVYYQAGPYNQHSELVGDHYQAVNIDRLRQHYPGFNDQPIELRFTSSKPDFKSVLLTYELLLKRIVYLTKNRSLDQLRHIEKIDPRMAITMSASEKLTRFYVFVTEMGGNFDRYRPLIYDPIIVNAPLDPDLIQQLLAANKEAISEKESVSEKIEKTSKDRVKSEKDSNNNNMKDYVSNKISILTEKYIPKNCHHIYLNK